MFYETFLKLLIIYKQNIMFLVVKVDTDLLKDYKRRLWTYSFLIEFTSNAK
jgi:hypothetical protein